VNNHNVLSENNIESHRKVSIEKSLRKDSKANDNERERFNSDLIEFPMSEYSHKDSFTPENVKNTPELNNSHLVNYRESISEEEVEADPKFKEKENNHYENIETVGDVAAQGQIELEELGNNHNHINYKSYDINNYIDQEQAKEAISKLDGIERNLDQLMEEINIFGE